MQTDIIGNRYQLLQKLGEGGMGTIYRAHDRLTGETVALKRLTVSPEQLQFASMSDTKEFRLALAQEFRTLASLRHPNIISVLDYGFDSDKQPFFTMEVLKNAKTIREAVQGKPPLEQLQMLMQMLYALIYLHRRNIIHRDLKPDNVLVVDEQVRVLDFGLAVAYDDTIDAEEIAGTMTYIAPEVLQGMGASPLSDLYAFGVIAYEIFAGHHPFDVTNPQQLLFDTLNTEADTSVLDVDTQMSEIIRRLLQKDPKARFVSAVEVLQAFQAVEPRLANEETEDIRESFLQAAEFVGRDEELSILIGALEASLHRKSAAWLVGGESGIGKSRLVDELRVRALVQGVQVLRGQAISSGASAYQIWRDLMRYLALLTEADTLEASVLKPFVPNIEALLNRSVPDAPRLDPKAVQTRLLSTVVSILKRQPYPMLLILEDLHWASAESLELLRAMLRQITNMPLLIVGTYRDDEAPTLPSALTEMNLLKLQRLSPQDINALSVSILGESGKSEAVVSLLQQETEGNVFFLVEVVRALAEDAGSLSQIGQITLPEHVFSGGIQKLVQRRLGRVSKRSRALLQLAAVIGRQLDVSVLSSLHKGSIENWLTESSNAAVLEFYEGAWRFAHDKLREGLLAELGEAERKTLHLQAARGIEALYGEAQASTLTYHYGIGGEQAKEAHFAAVAGSEALRMGANQDAVQYLETALAYSPTPLLQRQIAQAYYGLGNLGASRAHLERALEMLGERIPKPLPPAIVKEVVHQLLPIKAKRRVDEQALEVARIYGLIGEISYFTTETLLGIYSVLRMLNLAEGVEPSAELARANVNMCIAASLIPHYGLAERYGQRAEEVANALEDRSVLMQVLNIRGVYLTGTGQWARVDDALDRALALAEQLGDRREAITTRTTRAIARHYQGRFEEAIALNTYAQEAAAETGNVQQMGWGLYSRAENFNNVGRAEEACLLLEETLHTRHHDMQKSALIRIHAALSKSMLEMGKLDEAQKYITESLTLLGKTAPNVYSMLESYAAMGDVYLTLAEQTKPTDELFQKAQNGVRILNRYAKLYPVGKPRSLLWQGRLNRLTGKPSEESYKQALESAKTLDMAYEQLLAEQYLNGKSGNF
jgi:eukaryotic-like serine/threonine-protein kinase